jgi:hypothetical protein
MYCSFRCCKNISAIILDIGEPMDMPFCGWYVLFWKVQDAFMSSANF